MPVAEVHLRAVTPAMSRSDCWTLVLSRDGGEETRARYHPTYEEAVRVMFLRRDPWEKTWQEHLKERVYHLPWDEWAPWWIVEDPQRAWDACPDGGAMLWVLSRPELPLFTSEMERLARWCLDALGPEGLSREERAFRDALPAYESDEVRAGITELLRRTPDEPPPREPLTRWARRRMLVVPFLYLYGAKARLYEVGWLGEQLGFWGPVKLATLLRDLFPAERFTQTFADDGRRKPNIPTPPQGTR